MSSSYSKVIEAMHNDNTQEIEPDTYVISFRDAVKDLADHYCAECFTGKNAWLKECTDAWENKFMELENEFYEMDNRDLEIEYFDTFNVRIEVY